MMSTVAAQRWPSNTASYPVSASALVKRSAGSAPTSHSPVWHPQVKARLEPGYARGGQWQHHGKRAALAHGALHVDAAAVGLGDPAGDGQPQAGPAAAPGARAVQAVEPLEDACELVGGNAGPRIAHREAGGGGPPPKPAGRVGPR